PGYTTTGKADCAVASAHLVKFRGNSIGTAGDEPVPTITSGAGSVRPAGAAHALGVATANMVTLRGDNVGAAADAPVRTLSAGNEHHAVVECTLSPEQEAGALRVAAFLIRYYGQGGQWGGLGEPLDTITTKDRLALVTVHVRGVPYVIVDITLRMLRPPELYRATGFPPEYIIDRTADGRKLTVSQQVRMVGNAVS